MDLRTSLAREHADPPAEPARCPRCAAEWESQAPVEVHGPGDVRVRRCLRCGVRATAAPGARRWVVTCTACSLPFLEVEAPSTESGRCADCRDGQTLLDAPGPEVVAATEAEIRDALGRSWSFLASSGVSDYLDRLARQIARRIEGAPLDPRVVLVDDPAVRTLALPSGTLLLSLGALESLDDEAELAFLLGHELAHCAQGDAAGRLVRQGMQCVASEGAPGDEPPWVRAAEDLLRLGYGRLRERDADARGFEALRALRYDPQAALRWLHRLEDRMVQGDPAVAEQAVAHPTPADRRRCLERILNERPTGDEVLRVNREVFRRAAGNDVLRDQLRESTLDAARTRAGSGGRRWLKIVLAVAGVSLVAALILAAALLISG
jgi:predicted Zn-dependent protease